MINRWLRRVADWCVPASAIEWPHLTTGDPFAVDDQGWPHRVPSHRGHDHRYVLPASWNGAATRLEEFLHGYRLEGGDVEQYRSMTSGWRHLVSRGR
jgi:hypothetical protein